MSWTTYCCLCGGPPESKMKVTSWLKNFGAILPSD